MEKKIFTRKTSLAIYSFCCFFALAGCHQNKNARTATNNEVVKLALSELDVDDKPLYEEPTKDTTIFFRDLEDIKKSGKLIALTSYSYTSYFIYKGTPMGYEYELLQMLANELEVKLDIVVVKNMDEIFNMLMQGKGDVIADNLAITKEWDEIIDFTIPHNTTRQVLVQRLPEGWEKMSKNAQENSVIRNPIDLLDKEVHVRKETAYYSRLKNLSSELGGDINIKEAPSDSETEELILKVANGEISYTVADENVAKINKSFYPQLDIETAISFPQRVGWAVRENSPELKLAVNQWLEKMKQRPVFYAIYNKYYHMKKGVDEMVKCSKIASCGTAISPFDSIIKREAKKMDWDWRLVSSLVYQESRFKPSAKSWAGAIGLMQIMPRTAAFMGVKNPEDPEESIIGGVKYLGWLENYWKDKITDDEERIKFILASYNAGQEHVVDAQRLAKKYGKDPTIWDDNVAYYLLMKAKETYSKDPVVRYGYCRGEEPFKYVNEILERYEHYQKLIKEDVFIAEAN